MTAETLHDALTLLPTDLITETDKKRNRKAKVIHWKRYAAMAACLVLVAYCGLLFRSGLLSGSDAAKNEKSVECAAAAPAQMAPQETQADVTGDSVAEAEEDAAAIYDEEMGDLRTVPATESALENTVLYMSCPINICATQYADSRNVSAICIDSSPQTRLIRSREELETYYEENRQRYDLSEFWVCCEIYDEAWFEEHDLLLAVLRDLRADSTTRVTSMWDDNGIWQLHVSYTLPEEPSEERTDRYILMEAQKDSIANKEAVIIVLE